MEPGLAQEAVRLSTQASFHTSAHLAKEQNLRPWSQQRLSPGGSHRRQRQQLEALSAGRTEVLQAYLSEQLTRLSGDVAETFEASILGISGAADADAPAAQPSPSRRKRHSPRKRGPAASTWPHRSRPGVIMPHDNTSAGRSRSAGAATPTFPQVIDRWPAYSSAQQADDLGALRAPPTPLIVDDGVLFADNSRLAHSSARARARGADVRDVMDPPSRLSARSVSPARAAMSGQLLRTAPKLLQDLEYYLNRELEENEVAGADLVGSPVRARIIGECFDCFIEHCSTYKPLLAKIKSEYEETIALLREQVDSMQPNLNRLATLEHMTASEKVEQRVAHLRDTTQLREECSQNSSRMFTLQKRVAQLEEELKVKNKRMEKYADDAEVDYNANSALSSGLQAAKQQNAASQGLWLEKEGLALALSEAEKQRDTLSIALDGAVDSQTYSAVALAHEQLQEKHKNLASSETRSVAKVATLEARVAGLQSKNEALMLKLEAHAEVGTPRPDHTPLFLALRVDREHVMGPNPSTVGVFNFAVEQVQEKQRRMKELAAITPNDDPYFESLGTGEDIIPSLRTSKKRIRNFRMPKRDVEYFVKSLFQRKQIDDRQRAEKDESPTEFTDFLHEELTRKYIHQNRVAEVCFK